MKQRSPLLYAADRTLAGLDLAMRRDHAAIVIVDTNGDALRVLYDREWIPGKEPLRPTETVTEAIAIARDYGCESICADLHYIDLVKEYVGEMLLVPFPTTQEKKAEVYVKARVLLGQGKVDLSAASDALIRQLKQTTAKPTEGGGLSIGSKRGKDGHGDSVSALICALHSMGNGGLWEPFALPRRLISARWQEPDGCALRDYADED
jgi:hypothetical protein